MNENGKTCLLALIGLLGLCALIVGSFCLGISLIQLFFGTGHNILMAYWGLSLFISGRFISKIFVLLNKGE